MADYRKKDEDGRLALSFSEYEGLRTIIGAMNALTLYHQRLEKRCRSYRNGWRDLRCLTKLSEKVLLNVLETVPTKRLLALKRELENCYCETKVRGAATNGKDDFMLVERKNLLKVCEFAVSVNCVGCDKTHKQAKHDCALYKSIQELFNYDFDQHDSCPFSDGQI